MRDEDQQTDNTFHYENGIPVFEARLHAVENRQHEAESRQTTYRDQQLSIDKWVMVFTGILVLFSALTAIINGIYLRIAKTSADAARSAAATADATLKSSDLSFHQDQRAYLGVYFKGFVRSDELSAGEMAAVALQAINYGKTPAQHLQHYVVITLQGNANDQSVEQAFEASKQMSRSPNGVGIPVFHGVTNPTEYFSVWKGRIFSTWTAKEISDIEDQKRFLYVAGTVEYDDVFNMHHRTEICWYWNTEDEEFDVCSTHNNVE